MKSALLTALAMLLCAALAIAQICPSPAPEGYPSHRPEGTPANYPPAEEPGCYIQSTQATSLPFCTMCHTGSRA